MVVVIDVIPNKAELKLPFCDKGVMEYILSLHETASAQCVALVACKTSSELNWCFVQGNCFSLGFWATRTPFIIM